MQYQRLPIQGKTVVVVFDMCSSSDIIEGLTIRGTLQHLEDFLTKLKQYLASAQKSIAFDPYKFAGDGWILLFPEATHGKALFKFLRDLCTFFKREFSAPGSVLSRHPSGYYWAYLRTRNGTAGTHDDVRPTRIRRVGPQCRM